MPVITAPPGDHPPPLLIYSLLAGLGRVPIERHPQPELIEAGQAILAYLDRAYPPAAVPGTGRAVEPYERQTARVRENLRAALALAHEEA